MSKYPEIPNLMEKIGVRVGILSDVVVYGYLDRSEFGLEFWHCNGSADAVAVTTPGCLDALGDSPDGTPLYLTDSLRHSRSVSLLERLAARRIFRRLEIQRDPQ